MSYLDLYPILKYTNKSFLFLNRILRTFYEVSEYLNYEEKMSALSTLK